MHIGKKINHIRKQKNISVKELADQTGISQTAIYELFRGETQNPKSETLIKLAEYLDVSLDAFHSIQDDNKYIVSELELSKVFDVILNENPRLDGKPINQFTKDYIKIQLKNILKTVRELKINEVD